MAVSIAKDLAALVRRVCVVASMCFSLRTSQHVTVNYVLAEVFITESAVSSFAIRVFVEDREFAPFPNSFANHFTPSLVRNVEF